MNLNPLFFYRCSFLFIILATINFTVFDLAQANASPTPIASSPSKTCDVKVYGARGNGKDNDTKAIQSAIDDCKNKNGLVYFPEGQYLTAMITLGSDMTFRLSENATLIGIKDGDKAYPDLNPNTQNTQLLNCRKALLIANGVKNLTIEGPGTINGNGDWKAWGHGVKEARRPMAIFIVQSENTVIRHLQIQKAAMWALVLMETKHTLVSDVHIDSQFGPNRDGIDIVDGEDILIENSTVKSEDDSICLKSGVPSGLKKVVVRNSHIRGSLVANGLKFGTASVGILEDVIFENIRIEHVQQAGIALESVDGSHIRNIRYENIEMHDVGTAFYVLLGWRGDQSQPRTGSITDITFRNIRGSQFRQTWGSAISGTLLNNITYFPKNLLFEDIKLLVKGYHGFAGSQLPPNPPEYGGQYPDPRLWYDLPASGLYFRHVNGVHLRNVEIQSQEPRDQRPLILPKVNPIQSDFDSMNL